MDKALGVVALVAVLFLVARGLPGRRWPVVIAGTLALVLVVVLAEQSGFWPASWRVR
jgi:hypothetical protein